MGESADWTESSAIWEVSNGGDLRYKINTTDYSNAPGEGLGTFSIYDQTSYEIFDFTVECRSDENLATNSLADYNVVVGYTDDINNYYYIMFNSRESDTKIFSYLNNTRTTLATYDGAPPIDDNDFHTVRVTYANGTLTAYFDGVELMSVAVALPEGKIGLGGYNDAASFDDPVVLVPPNVSTDKKITFSGNVSFSGSITFD